MRDSTVPYTRAEEIRYRVLLVSFCWPILAVFPVLVLFWMNDILTYSKFGITTVPMAMLCSIGLALMGMFPLTMMYMLIYAPCLFDCHPEYNNWHFYWQYIVDLNFLPAIAVITSLVYVLG